MKWQLSFLLLIFSLSTPAQITTDGSPWAHRRIYYQIGADLGQQRGGNLFHSFRDFNLQSFESVVMNFIGRIKYLQSFLEEFFPSGL
jgi:hypothetical protein